MAMKNRQLNLFETEPKQAELVQIKGKTLDKNQLKFNKLVGEIRKSNEELKMLSQVLPEANAKFMKVSFPLQETMFKTNLNLIKAADSYLKEMKLSKNQKAVVQDYILFKIRELPKVAPPEIEEIFDAYSEIRYQEEMDSGKEEVNNGLKEMLKNMYGVEIDVEFDPNLSEEENAKRIFQKLADNGIHDFSQKQFSQKQSNQDNSKGKIKKKKLDESAIENKQQKEEQLRKMSFNAIYKELMKAFHPDTETDPERKAEKEEISKKITVAYGNQDYFELLNLEAEYLSNQEDRIQKMPKEQLAFYIKMLTDQKAELKGQIDLLRYQYETIYFGLFVRKIPKKEFEKTVKREIEEEIKQVQVKVNYLSIRDLSHRKFIIDFMEEELDDAEFDMFGFDF